jgi:acyl-ACP thioesterase
MAAREPDAWSAPYRVRFDEAGPDGRLRTSSLLRYAQDLAWYHSASRGYGRDWYAERGITWLVRAAEVGVAAAITVGSELVGTTRVTGSRRVWARRRTDFVDAVDALVASVDIDWVLLDARGAPTRIPAEFEGVFGTASAGLSLARVDLGATPPEARRLSIVVRPQELDPMDHVNNAVYADWLDEAIIAAGARERVEAIPRLARLEYVRAAEPAEELTGLAWDDPGGWSFRVTDLAGADRMRARLEPPA